MDNYQGKEVLITGGLGFIGSNLARALVSFGAKVTVIDSLIAEYGGNFFNVNGIENAITICTADIRDSLAVSNLLSGKDYLFNLAGQTSHLGSMEQPQIDLDINARAQLNILEACRINSPGIKVVFTSTRQLYGRPKYLPVDEDHPICPVDINGINKLAGEKYHLLYGEVYGLRTCVLRLTNTYGPGMRVKDAKQIFLGIWVRELIEGSPIKIFGDGLQLRDFNYVDDCVNAILLAGASDTSNGKIYNLGGGQPVSLNELAGLMIDARGAGSFELVEFPPNRKAIDVGNYYGDFSLISGELGWAPRINLAEGLKATLSYYEKYHHHYWE